VLSPGVDPVRSIELLGEKMGITYDSEGMRLHNVSLGQGQEQVAMDALEECFEKGGWALLSNIHLVEAFLKNLEKKFEHYSEVYTKMAQVAKRRAELKAHRRAVRRQQAADAAAAHTAGNAPADGDHAGEDHHDGDNGVAHADGEHATASGDAAAAAPAAAAADAGAAKKPATADGGEHANGSDNSDLDDLEGAAARAPGEDAGDAEEEEELDEDLEAEMEGSEFHMEEKPGHKDFRVFLTAEPSELIPIGILQRSIKLTSEPPSGIQANVLRALSNFSSEPWEQNMAKPNDYRSIMFVMCFVGDTPVTTANGLAKPIRDFGPGDQVLSYDPVRKATVRATVQQRNPPRRANNLVELTFADGRTIICTDDHRFLPANIAQHPQLAAGQSVVPEAAWVEARHLSVHTPSIAAAAGPESAVAMDVQGTRRLPITDADRAWTFTVDVPAQPNHPQLGRFDTLRMNEEREIDRTLAFFRIAGFLESDGSISEAGAVRVALATVRDCNQLLHDWKLLGGGECTTRPAQCSDTGAAAWEVLLHGAVAQALQHLGGRGAGDHVHQDRKFPAVIMDPATPVAVVAAFLSGIMGGDCSKPCLQWDGRKFAFSATAFWQTCSEKNEPALKQWLADMCSLLTRCGVLGAAVGSHRRVVTGFRGRQGYKRCACTKHIQLSIVLSTAMERAHLLFENVGVAYCVDKHYRLAIAAAYNRYLLKIQSQHKFILDYVYKKVGDAGARADAVLLAAAVNELRSCATPVNDFYCNPPLDYVNVSIMNMRVAIKDLKAAAQQQAKAAPTRRARDDAADDDAASTAQVKFERPQFSPAVNLMQRGQNSDKSTGVMDALQFVHYIGASDKFNDPRESKRLADELQSAKQAHTTAKQQLEKARGKAAERVVAELQQAAAKAEQALKVKQQEIELNKKKTHVYATDRDGFSTTMRMHVIGRRAVPADDVYCLTVAAAADYPDWPAKPLHPATSGTQNSKLPKWPAAGGGNFVVNGLIAHNCFFHAVVIERKKFGPQGWNRVYPFNVGDLTTCLQVTSNFIEDRPKVPWEDLRYVFGEIMYGGHITDDWDRTLCMAYLQTYVVPDCLDSLELAPGFVVPPPMSYSEYLNLVQGSMFPPESPVLYGLHPNAEINFRTAQADVLFRTINELQPAQSAQAGALTREEIVRSKAVDILDHLPEPHNIMEISERLLDERTPQQHVFYQECERMNFLTARLRETLTDLRLGLDGALSISPAMQQMADELYMDKVPESWQRVSFMSMRPLSSWFDNYNQRNAQLLDWVPEMQTPKVTMLSYFFNPMSFLTAIMQTAVSGSHSGLELDKMMLVADVLKKMPDSVDTPAREGAHVAGIVMEGARWDTASGTIEDSRMKELYPRMPVVTIRAQQLKHQDTGKDLFQCPMYKTQARGPGFVTGLGLRTKQAPRKWTIAGVAMLLDVVE
jgi:hypothetical protein